MSTPKSRTSDEPAPLSDPAATASRRRLLQLARLGAAVSLALLGLYLAPDVCHYAWEEVRLVIPNWLGRLLETGRRFVAAGVLAVPLTIRPGRVGSWRLPETFWEQCDALGGWIFTTRWFNLALACGSGLLLLGWVPHYLTWPWWSDTDYFAVTAQAWDAGILPYRDLYDFNFPGPTYLHWLLGHLFGWGRTAPFQAFDAGLIVALGAALALWSRARFETPGPGLVAFLAVLMYYLSLDYSTAGQRDWQAPLFALLGIMLLEGWRGFGAVVGSGLLFALALSFRPHVILLCPATLAALDEHARRDGDSWRVTARTVAVWSVVVALGLVAAAAPVLLAGVAGDFLHWFRSAWYGGTYRQGLSTVRSFRGELLGPLRRWQDAAVLALVVGTALVNRSYRRTTVTWTLALTCLLLYRPLSPHPHDYLIHPTRLAFAVALAIPAAGLWRTSWLSPSVRVVFLAALLFEICPAFPEYWDPHASGVALRELSRGVRRPAQPPGCGATLFLRRTSRQNFYAWEDYRGVLDYVRTNTGPETRVGALFRSNPFPTVNGPTGRLPLFPSPGGILWLRYAAPDLQGPFEAALARPGDAVVVWGPELPAEPRLRLERLVETVRRLYQLEARFGSMEVWRRKSSTNRPGNDAGFAGRPREMRLDVELAHP